MRKTTAALAVLGSTAALVAVGGAGTAQAAERCHRTSLTFDLPNRPDMEGYAELCVERVGSRVWASMLVQLEGVPIPASDRFDGFTLVVRVERNDAVMASTSKNVTADINNGRIFTDSISVSKLSSTRGGWTADGVIRYNVNNDGKGSMNKELHGSPSVS